MNEARSSAPVLVAVLGGAAGASAQQNQHEVSGSVPQGGTAEKPKNVGFSFGFQTSEAAGNLPGSVTFTQENGTATQAKKVVAC